MFKNVATKIVLIAWDTSANTLKTGDAANITAYVIKDGATPAALADTSATELDSTNFKGAYVFDVAAGETNATDLLFGGKSSTSNIIILPARVTTVDLANYGIIESGTAQGTPGNTTVQMASTSGAYATNACAGMILAAYGSTQGYWQFRRVLSNTSGAGGTLTTEPFTVTVSGTVTYKLFGSAPDGTLATAVATIAKLEAAFASSGVFSSGALVNTPSAGYIRSGSATSAGTTSSFTDTAITETGTDAQIGKTGRFTSGPNVGRSFVFTGSTGTAVQIAPTMPTAVGSGDTYNVYQGSLVLLTPAMITAIQATLASQTSVDDLPTNAELATALAAADDATLAAIAALNNISAAGVRSALGMASANLDTQLDAIPTNSDLATALDPLPTAAENAAAIGGRSIPDSYSVLHAQPTVEQAILEIHRMLMGVVQSGSSLLIKKPDGTTTAMTFTLDSATNPSSVNRSA